MNERVTFEQLDAARESARMSWMVINGMVYTAEAYRSEIWQSIGQALGRDVRALSREINRLRHALTEPMNDLFALCGPLNGKAPPLVSTHERILRSAAGVLGHVTEGLVVRDDFGDCTTEAGLTFFVSYHLARNADLVGFVVQRLLDWSVPDWLPEDVETALRDEWAAARVAIMGEAKSPEIPSDLRTIPMTLSRAAKLMGRIGSRKKAAEWLRKCIDDGKVQAEKINRQTYVFSRQAFPKEQWCRVTPKKTGPN